MCKELNFARYYMEERSANVPMLSYLYLSEIEVSTITESKATRERLELESSYLQANGKKPYLAIFSSNLDTVKGILAGVGITQDSIS